MMKKCICVFPVLLLFSFSTVFAQSAEPAGKFRNLDFGVGFGNQSFELNTAFFQTFGVGPAGKFKLRYGLRFNWFRSFSDLDYVTAPAKIRTGKAGWQYLLTSSIPSRLDTFVTENPAIGSVNLTIHAGYLINPQLEVGLNAELIGLGFGSEQDGIYRSPERESIPLTVSGRPENFNFIFSSKGAYQTEFFARYWLAQRWGLKAGLDLYHSVYVTEREMNFGNRRFRNLVLLFSASFSYRWGI